MTTAVPAATAAPTVERAMFENVVVGVDGRPGGDDAVALARQLAAPDARVTLANIYGSTSWPPGSGGLFLEEQRAGARAFLARERDRWPGAATVCAAASTVGRGLHELAAHRAADLLVVGSTHRGIPGRVLVGDDTRATFNAPPCAIAIAPHGFALDVVRVRRIGVGYDDTAESRRALAAARSVAEHTGAGISVMRVVSLEEVQRQTPLPADWPSTTAALVDQAQRELNALDGVHGIAVYGGPREELTKLSSDVDLLVVGSRGHGRFGGAFHGSVSSYLEHHVASALLVLPREVRDGPPEPAEELSAGTLAGA
jgi:nucleotide-binding universal stress UspA family protein